MTGHLPYDFEPALAPVVAETELAPLSFVNPNYDSSLADTFLTGFGPQPTFSFDSLPFGTRARPAHADPSGADDDRVHFYLDPTIGGGAFDEPPESAPTPDLVAPSANPSPESDVGGAGAGAGGLQGGPSEAFMTPYLAGDEGNGKEVVDYESLLGGDGLGLPIGFGWEGAVKGEEGRGGWDVYGEPGVGF